MSDRCLPDEVFALSKDTLKADIIIVIDGSASISNEDWTIITFSMRHLLTRINLQRSRVAIVQFSTHARIEHEFSDNLYSLLLAVNNMKQMRQNTNTKVALELCDDMFMSRTANAESMIIMLTDGDSSDNPDNKALELRELKSVKIVGIGVGSDVSRVRLEKVATLGHCHLIPSMAVLRKTFTQIGIHAFKKPDVKVLRRFCDKFEIQLACSEEISEFKVELFDESNDTADKYKLVRSIVVPNPNEALVTTFIEGLTPSTEVSFRVYGIMKNNRRQTELVYVKDKTLSEKRDSGLLKDPELLRQKIEQMLNEIKAWSPDHVLANATGVVMAKIILLGRAGEGKSSCINTIIARFAGEFKVVAVAMTHHKTVTSSLTEYPLKDSNVVVMDSFGWEDEGANYTAEEQELICTGVLGDGYKEGEQQATYFKRVNGNVVVNASFDRAVHAVIMVCDIDAVTNKAYMTRLKDFEKQWTKEFGRSVIVLLTKCDLADAELINHPESIYDSEIVEKRINTLHVLTGIDKGNIYPCINRVSLNVSNPDVREYLALKALHASLFTGVNGLFDNETRRIEVQQRRFRPSPTKVNAQSPTATEPNAVSSPQSDQLPEVVTSRLSSIKLEDAPLELLLGLPGDTYEPLYLKSRTVAALKQEIVKTVELESVDNIGAVFVHKVVCGETLQVNVSKDEAVQRLQPNQVVYFTPK